MIDKAVEVEAVEIIKPNGVEFIFGQGTFNILAIEDIYRAIAVSSPSASFGIAFNEGSDLALQRKMGNNEELTECASLNMLNIGCGHCFMIAMKDCYPINVLTELKGLATVVNIKAATGNPATAIVARLGGMSAFLGVADGNDPNGVETTSQKSDRQKLIRNIGYLPKVDNK